MSNSEPEAKPAIIPGKYYPHGPDDAIPDFTDEEAIAFLKTPGSYLCRQPEKGYSIYDPTIKSLVIVPITELPEDHLRSYGMVEDEAYLIEHLATGFCYLMFKSESEYWDKQGLPTPYSKFAVTGFEGTKDEPKNIVFELDNTFFEPASPDSLGSRIGGKPMNSDGTEHKGLWPYFEGEPLPFLAQYELQDGRYVHVFADKMSEHANYCFEEENAANCAIVEGGEIPHWVEMKSIDEPLIVSAPAYKPVKKYDIPYTPQWRQEDIMPDDAGLIFLGQISEEVCADDDEDGKWEYSVGDAGALYVFANPETGRARVVGDHC